MKIYVGTKTASDYLWEYVANVDSKAEVRNELGTRHCNTCDRLEATEQDEPYLRHLAEIVLGHDNFSIGYMAVTNHATYYSDNLSKVIIQVTGKKVAKAINSIAEASGFTRQYIYSVVSGKRYLTDSIVQSIRKTNKALILVCLSPNKECFGQGISFTANPDWEFVYDNSVKDALVMVASMQDEEQLRDVELDDVFIDPSDEVNDKIKSIAYLEEFNKLNPTMKKLVIDYAKVRLNCQMTNEQIVMDYLINKLLNKNDTCIQDLLKII